VCVCGTQIRHIHASVCVCMWHTHTGVRAHSYRTQLRFCRCKTCRNSTRKMSKTTNVKREQKMTKENKKCQQRIKNVKREPKMSKENQKCQ